MVRITQRRLARRRNTRPFEDQDTISFEEFQPPTDLYLFVVVVEKKWDPGVLLPNGFIPGFLNVKIVTALLVVHMESVDELVLRPWNRLLIYISLVLVK